MNAANRVFAGAEIKGCFSHLSQNIFRQVQEKGLQNRYRDDSDFSLAVRMVAALAFVPVEKITEAYEELEQHLDDDDYNIICDYFEDNYIGRQRRTGRRAPRFSHGTWKMINRTEEELLTTNNHVEGLHRRMRAGVKRLSSVNPEVHRSFTELPCNQCSKSGASFWRSYPRTETKTVCSV